METNNPDPRTTSNLLFSFTAVLSTFVTMLGSFVVIVFIQQLRENLGLSESEASRLFGPAMMLIAAVLALGASFAADYLGRERVLAFCVMAASISMIGAANAGSAAALLVAVTSVTCFATATLAITIAVLAGHFRHRWIATIVGVVYIVLRLGSMAGASLRSLEVAWSTAMFSTAGMAAACAVVLFLVAADKRAKMAAGSTPPFDIGLFWILVAGFVALQATVASVNQWSVALLMQLGDLQITEILFWIGWKTPVAIAGFLVGGLTADELARTNKRAYANVAIAGSAIVTLALVALSWTTSVWAIASLQMVIAFAAALVAGPIFGLAQRLSRGRFNAAAAATILLAASLASVFGSTITGSLSDLMPTGLEPSVGLRYALVSLSPLGIVAGIAFWFVARRSELALVDEAEETAHINALGFQKQGGDEAVHVYVKNGFSWPAFFFGPIWAWSKGMVGVGFGLLLGNIVVRVITSAGAVALSDSGVAGILAFDLVIIIGWLVFVGVNGNEWRRRSLRKRGFTPTPPESGGSKPGQLA